jgi:phosphatidylserine decarboxylase
MEKKYQIFDLKLDKLIEEPIYGEDFLRFCYTHPVGKVLTKYVFTKRPINNLYALYKNSSFSKKQIAKDIERFNIDMSLFEENNYLNFKSFFLRKFKKNIRHFSNNADDFGAFCEGKFLAYEKISNEIKFPVKGTYLSAKELLQNSKWEHFFNESTILICRLCPADYHYYHYPDNGSIIESYTIPGVLHSVSQLALSFEPKVFCLNERKINILKSENFGHMAFIEVGAMVVGRICQTHTGEQFKKGDEKGYFDFGGSTVIVFVEKNKLKLNSKLLENSKMNIETHIELGFTVGNKL